MLDMPKLNPHFTITLHYILLFTALIFDSAVFKLSVNEVADSIKDGNEAAGDLKAADKKQATKTFS